MATTISSSNSDVGTNHQYLGFIIGQKKHFNFVVVDSVTSELISNAFVEGDEVKEFVEDISHIFNQKFKAVFLNVGEYQSEVYPKSYDFCKELKAALNLCNIPNHFFTHLQWCLSGLLISSGYIPTIDQYVLFVTQFGDEANVICYKYTQNGYANVATKDVDISESRDDENICADILQLCPNPSISIIKANAATMKRFKKLLKNLKIFSVPQDFSIVDPKYITEHSKWFFDRSFSNFHVLPVPSSMVKLFVQDGSQEFSFIVISNHAQLPVSHSRTVQKIVNYCCVSMNKEIILEKCLPDQKAHQHNVTLSIDEEGFVDYKVEAILLPHVHILQYKLTTNLKSGIPVITFIENLSFICIKKDGKTDYEYLESWNGKFGMDLYISFDEEKPKYCQDALEVARTEPTFSVFGMLFCIL
uniref:Uncharacterized protein n=1 Tax=Panagrolaimus superbus TaxID=310955 RepID=A0A914XVG9_9BILA